jgi:dihydroorotate dehydrogenase
MTLVDRAARALRLLDPERAHRLAIAAAARGKLRASPATADPRLAVNALGLTFPNPIGLAAGFDKNAEAPDAMLAAGFGFVEIGTVTPLPQDGNPKPRLFRLPADRAIVNRLGFNNEGHDAVSDRLEARSGRGGIVGANIGANRDSEDRFYDYVAGVRLFAPLASYLTINISSPNTPGLRELQGRHQLVELLVRASEARTAAAKESGRRTPMLLKIAPDLSDAGLDELIGVATLSGIDGRVVSNTTVHRPQLKSRRHAAEQGGLSGAPLFEPSTAMLARARQLAGPEMTIVGVGGVDSAATAWSKLAAGADLIQLYTGLVYRGPTLPGQIAEGLLKRLDERHIGRLSEIRGIETDRWANAWSRFG